MRADGLPGANVFLSVNDSVLHEHGTEVENCDPNHAVTALAYVESVPGATFAVNIILDPAFQHRSGDLRADIYMDGTRMKSKIMVDVSRRPQSVKIDNIHEVKHGQDVIRRFLFAEHQTSMYRDRRH